MSLSRTPLALVGLVAAAPLAAQSPARPATTVLDTVRVTSRTAPAAATRSAEVITRDDIARLAARSLSDVLARALGADVQSRSPAQSDVSLRGSSFNQVVVLVDGVRVSDVQSGHYALDLAVPTAMIERVEILRGTGSALYGSDAVGGVVNVVTRGGEARRLASIRGGSFGGAAGALAATRDVGAYRVAAGIDGDRSSGHRDGTDYDVTQARASVGRATPLGRATLDVGQGLRRFGAADFYSPYPSEETTRSTTAALRLDGDDARRVAVSAALHTRRHRDLFTLVRTDPARYQNEHLSWETGGEASARVALAPAAAAVVGTELLEAQLRSARLGDRHQLRAGAFGELSLGSAGRPTLDAGLRADRVEGVGSFVSPSLSAALPLRRLATLHGSVGRGFRAPTWTERYYRDPSNISDSSLAVERFTSGEVGLRAALGALPASADLTLYQRDASSLIDWARPAGSAAAVPWHTMNFASATYRGAEALVRATTPGAIDWTLRASGLRFTARAADGLEGKYALRPLTRTLGAEASRSLGTLGALAVDAERARRAGEAGYTLLNARLAARLGGAASPVQASLELLNLGGARYLDGAGQRAAGRAAFVGLRWDARS